MVIEYDYTTIRPLRLEIASYRFFVHPYGPQHDDAVGRLYSWSNMPYDFISLHKEFYFNRIEPQLDEGETYPIKFVSQEEGSVVVKIDFSGSRLWDVHKRDGLEVTLYA